MAGLVGCGQAPTVTCPEDLSSKVAALEAELVRLRAENEALRLTPVVLLADVSAAIAADDLARAATAQAKLADRFPTAPETAIGAKQVADLEAAGRLKEEEAARLAALGFKALRVNANFEGDGASIVLRSTSVSGQWSFDAYDNEWHYLESERGQKYVTARARVSSQRKNPLLMGLGVYVADGDRLRRIGRFGYRFARWRDYGSYLGNYADYRNDFAHTEHIEFSLGATVNQADIKRPLYIVATKEGCFERSQTQFQQPPVRYVERRCATLADTLSIADFESGRLGILKRLE